MYKMAQRTFSLGFDDERPYGALASTPQGKTFREEKLAFVRKMHERFDVANIPRTHFILTSYLEAARNDVGTTLLRDVYPKKNDLLDLQQHSHTHGIVEPLSGVNRPVMKADEYTDDIAHASTLMSDILDVQVRGLRTPYGYEKDFSHRPDVLSGLRKAGITFVSSDLGMKDTLAGAVTKERQPHSYRDAGFPDIVEVPAHGLQDVVYTKEKAKQLFGKEEAPSADEAFRHYDHVLNQAMEIEAERVSIALCLHPWAVMEYDPELELLLKISESARQKGFEILSYGQVSDKYR